MEDIEQDDDPDDAELLELVRGIPGGELLAEAVTKNDIELMTYEELGRILGVKKTADGGFNSTEFFQACLDSVQNPKVISLPREKQLQVIASAAAALDNMR